MKNNMKKQTLEVEIKVDTKGSDKAIKRAEYLVKVFKEANEVIKEADDAIKAFNCNGDLAEKIKEDVKTVISENMEA